MQKLFVLFFSLFFSLPTFAQADDLKVLTQAVYQLEDYLDEKRFDEVLAQIDTLIVSYPEVSIFYRIKGDAISKKSERFDLDSIQYQKALGYYNKAIEVNPKNFDNYYSRSKLLFSFHQFFESINDVSYALKICDNNQDRAQALKHRSIIFIYLNKTEEAIADCKAILEIYPNSDNTYSNLGLLFLRTKEYKKAEDLFRTAIEMNPSHVIYHNNLGIVYLRQDKYKEAEELYSEMISKSAEPDALLLNNRGFARVKLGKLKLAWRDINRSIELYPSNSYAFRNRALLFVELKKMDRACQDIEKALSLNFTELYGEEVLNLQKEFCQ